MKVVVIVPEEYMGDVIGDLNARRGQIQGYARLDIGRQADQRASFRSGEMFGYATDLRSKTQGRGSYCHGAQPLCGSSEDPFQEAIISAQEERLIICEKLIIIAEIVCF